MTRTFFIILIPAITTDHFVTYSDYYSVHLRESDNIRISTCSSDTPGESSLPAKLFLIHPRQIINGSFYFKKNQSVL